MTLKQRAKMERLMEEAMEGVEESQILASVEFVEPELFKATYDSKHKIVFKIYRIKEKN